MSIHSEATALGLETPTKSMRESWEVGTQVGEYKHGGTNKIYLPGLSCELEKKDNEERREPALESENNFKCYRGESSENITGFKDTASSTNVRSVGGDDEFPPQQG